QSHQLFATIEGQLRADAVVGPNGTSLTIDVDRIILDGRRWITSGGAVVGIGGQPESSRVDQWRTGRRIRIPATLRKPSRFMNEGVADSQRESGWRGVALVGSSKSDRLVEVIARGSQLSELLSWARAWVRRGIALSVGDWSAQSAAVVTAILIGDRAGLD